MTRKKILFIANGNNIHDIKWISYFSSQTDRYKCYLLCDTLCILTDKTKAKLKEMHIEVVPQIEPFSISHPLRTIKAIKFYKNVVGSIQPNLIHVLFATPNALWLNYTKTPSIITMRGSDILKVIPNLLEQSGLKKIYFTWLFQKFKMAFRNAHTITGTSSSQIEKAKELFGNINLKLIRTGIDVEALDSLNQINLIPEDLRNKKIIFSPRFMSPIYNIEFQIEAISLLGKKIIDGFVFVFIRGKQYDQEYYNRQLEKLKVLNKDLNLQFLVIDYLNQSEVWMMMKKASLCLMTPTSDGTPNSALEAMAAKCPLIVSNLNYDKDLFENTCYKLNSFEIEELKSTIEKAIFNPNPILISNAFNAVNVFGNRAKEMNKLGKIYDLIP
jgi:glycosyltransferase involved in cell wall biosynthesis